MSTINTNVQSLNAQRNLMASQGSLSTAMQRLSSGLRINSAKDDAAGLAISERMNAQVKGLNVAARNANDGISLAQTAEGALGKVGDMLQRMRELAVQSSNSTNTQDDRNAMNTEVTQLKDEIGRVASQTSFNGITLLNGSSGALVFQVGANAGESITLSQIASVEQNALGGSTNVAKVSTLVSSLTDFGNAIAATTGFTIDGGTAAGAVDIGAIGAATSASERGAQLVEAINRVSTQTGVGASINSTSGELILQNRGGSITVAGAGSATEKGFANATTPASTSTGITNLSVASYSDSQLALSQIDNALKQVNTSRADLGATQSRFESAISSINIQGENISAARSRIVDADFAKETSNLSRAQILQQAGTAMVAQANQLPQGVLALLR
jgi:flagellin